MFAFLAQALPYVSAASAAMSAIGAIQRGKTGKAVGEYNATIARQNADLAKEEAQMLDQQQARENYLRVGSIRAAQGASGGTQSGSVFDVIADVAQQGELQRQQIRLGGRLKARDFTNTATLDDARARMAKTESYYQAGSELLSGASSMYTNSLLKRSG